jgi:surface polysaccharide O-acyltransferase-like enzyme
MAVCVALISSGFPSPAIAYGLAIVPVCLACGWQSKSNGLTAALAPLTFGVYLIHPLIAFGLKTIFSVERDHAALIALTVCISGLVTWGLMKTPLRRFV